MLGFAVKKAFFDLWDNLIAIVLMNLATVALVAVSAFFVDQVATGWNGGAGLTALSAVAALAVIVVYLGGVALACAAIADYRAPTVASFAAGALHAAPAALSYYAGSVLLGVVLSVGAPLYAGFGNVIGLLALAGIVWLAAVWALAGALYFAVRARLESRVIPLIKKSILLLFDNLGFAVLLLVTAPVIVTISLPFAFMFPGPAGAMQWVQSAVKLRLLKYEYLERNPQPGRRRVPWNAVLVEERRAVGPRSLKSTLFPWKD